MKKGRVSKLIEPTRYYEMNTASRARYLAATSGSAKHANLALRGGNSGRNSISGRLYKRLEHHLMQHFEPPSQKQLRQHQHAPEAHGLGV
jgi:hypothetical protein